MLPTTATTTRTFVLLTEEAFRVIWTSSLPPEAPYPDPVDVRTGEFDPDSPIFEILDELFPSGHPDANWPTAEGGGGKFTLLAAPSLKPHPTKQDLTPISIWESADELVHFAHIGLVSDVASLSDLDRSNNSGYLRVKPAFIYVVPLQGVGATGFIGDLLSNLVWLGVGGIVNTSLYHGKELRRTSEAKRIAQSFKERGIFGVEQIRFWAATRENWVSSVAAKKLGVSIELMDSIFDALGYVKRFEDQTWRLGNSEKYRIRQDEWIAAEPSARQLLPPESPTDHERN